MTIQALVQDDANAPLVASCVVFVASNNLWSHVLTGSNHTHGRCPVSASVPPIE